MEIIPVGLIIFKLVVLGLGMFFAIKWHYDQDKKARKGDVISAVGKIAAILAVSLISLLLATYAVAMKMGLDLTLAR
ncbi:hypothetical protein [Sphingobium sp.]|uniref:hypothetical protein n=1 Tax=Sphingobium sp. TaxID=1912891 RepID=UPI0035C70C7F